VLESTYQARLIKKLERLLPGCLVLKNDSGYRQGIPDLLILFQDRWAFLEVKASEDAPYQPNQEYYLDLGRELSFAACIYPTNEREVLRELQCSFESDRPARVS
jgi:hypothetical protein